MVWIIFSVCLVLFIISFSILFRKQLKKTFKAIGNFFKSCSARIKNKKFDKNRKKLESGKVKRLTFSNAQKRPILLGPNQPALENTQEENKIESEKKEDAKKLTENFQSKHTFDENKKLENSKKDVIKLEEENSKSNGGKVDFSKLDEMISSYEKQQRNDKPKFGNIRITHDHGEPVRFIDNTTPIKRSPFKRSPFMSESNRQDDFLKSVERDKAYSKIINDNMESLKSKINTPEFKTMQKDNIMLDGVEINLQKLPPNLRRLLLSGLLERPNFDDLN